MTAPRTQKAKGVLALQNRGRHVESFLVQNPEDLSYAIGMLGAHRIFVRPCPVTPRHGFLDSRYMSAAQSTEIAQLLEQAQELDPGAELLLSRYIDSEANVTLVPGMVSVGKGNDGATSGRDSWSIPLPATEYLPAEVLKKAGVHETPYIEAVIAAGTRRVFLTQVRNGPNIPGSVTDRWVPHEMRVREIIAAEGDLLEWEAKIAALNSKEGLVCWHPGGNLLSHYSVHCRLNNIPVLCWDDAPRLGLTLQPTNGGPVEYDLDSFWRGIEAGLRRSLDIDSLAQEVEKIVFTLHSAPTLTGEHTKFVGLAVATLLRLGTIASRGECRYRPDQALKKNCGGIADRSTIYERGLRITWPKLRRLIPSMYKAFREQTWKSSYGGNAWARCVKTLVDLDKALCGVKTADDIKSVVEALNVAVNAAHNGGWWLNKYCSSTLLATNLAEGEVSSVIHAAYELWKVRYFERAFKGTSFKDFYAKASPIKLLRYKSKKNAGPVLKFAQFRELDGELAVRVQIKHNNSYLEFSRPVLHSMHERISRLNHFRTSYHPGSSAKYARGRFVVTEKTPEYWTLDIYAWGSITLIATVKVPIYSQESGE